ncbi:MAG: asparagine synthase (glutamine-hydrolyzing), partial [Pseudonocardiaceae bacterium]
MAGTVSSGICRTDPEDIRESTRRLAHRGPDAQKFRLFNHCSLIHTRLRVIDLSPLGDQPMSNDAETIWVVFNGELYNYVDLRCELQAAGHHLRTKTDTEVLVHLYELYGDEFVGRLRGMFAFAIWDEPGQRLLLCRDRVGIKPLYHRTTDAGLEFASEVRALARATDRLDVQAIASYLRLGWIPGPGTVYSQIKELPPAHLLRWEDGSTEVRRYWSPPFAGHKPSAPTVHALAQVLEDAVRRHLVADVPVGLFLSSGVDSAVVAELARRTDPAVRSYTVTFDTGEDEGRDASALARKLGLDHTLVQIGGEEILCSLDRFIADMDQPSVDGLNSWIISGAVRDAGLVVALSGLGGDELFGGYSTFRHVPRLAWAGRAMCWLPDDLWKGVQ